MVKEGDLIELRDGTRAIATSNIYTHRKMEEQDHEMVACGMGHLAGVYCSAFNIIIPETGKTQRIIFGDHKFKKIADVETTQ